MSDGLRLLATVSHIQAESAAEDLEQIADKKEAKLDQKAPLSDPQNALISSNRLESYGPSLFDTVIQTPYKSLEPASSAMIDGNLSLQEESQGSVQFEIQVATSDLQNAENVRSQAEKRLETQRKDLTRNWAG